MDKIRCPYCDFEQHVNHDEGYGFKEDIVYEQLCPKCDRHFAYSTSISYSYSSWAAPCIDDGQHQFELTDTIPKCESKMRCKICGLERNLTEEERAKYNIGTDKEYFNSIKNII